MDERKSYWLTKLKRVRRALLKNGINAFVVETREDACKKALSLIPKGSTVGLGGSRTVVEIGLLEKLREGNYDLLDQYSPGLSRSTALEIRKKGTHAQYFVCGSNAITEDGKIVNIDGLGNRLAALAFGPQKVIIVAGRNKIVKDVNAAIERVKNVAAPMNARRFGLELPCVRSGRCEDCTSSQRICNLTLIIEKQREKNRMNVILINEELGF